MKKLILVIAFLFSCSTAQAVALSLHGGSGDKLWQIDTSTGASTLVGPESGFNIGGLAGISSAPVPEPATIALLGIGIVGLIGGAAIRKRKQLIKAR